MSLKSLFAQFGSLLVLGGMVLSPGAKAAGEVVNTEATPSAQTPKITFPPAKSAIENKASASFLFGPQPVQVESNTVRVLVAEVPGIALQSDQTLSATPGATVVFPHTLWNTGNTRSNYSLSVQNLGGNPFNLENLRLFRDQNANGRLDTGEPLLQPSELIPLDSGGSFPFLAVGTLPQTATARQNAQIQIRGTVQGAPELVTSNTDTVRVDVGASVSLSKSASKTQAQPGEVVRFTLQAQSNGSVSPLPIDTVVDGRARKLLVLRDAIPANTRFQNLSGPAQGLALYHRIGAPLHTYVSTPPADLDAVAWGLETFEPGTLWRLDLDLQMASNAGGEIQNVARLYAQNPLNREPLNTDSNAVRVTLPILPPTLNYYANDAYAKIASVTTVGRPLYLQGVASACNQNAAVIERADLSVQSALTGDRVQVVAVETGPNTGVFRVERPIPTDGKAPNASDGILQIRRNDTLNARLSGCSTADATAIILIDPLGVVFDSRTGAPILGAVVTLINNATGQPASVLQFDGITPAPSTVTTGANGEFQFPLVDPGVYRLQIVAPQGFTFPSRFSPNLLPPGFNILQPGSYGGTFTVSAQTGAVQVDVPLDPSAQTGLFVEKVAARTRVEKGETLDYSVTISNVLGIPMTNLVLRDVLPYGFSFLRGTARRDGVALADPFVNGRELSWNLGAFAFNAKTVVSYRVAIGAMSKEGEARNSAAASADSQLGPQNSNTSVATVRVSGGAFSTRGIILGRVFLDENGNRQFDTGELPVAGARVLIEDGTFAITDKNGQWSLYGLRATTHVVKVDRTSLPSGFVLQIQSVMSAGRGDSTFADLKNAELLRVDFALKNGTPELKDELAKRLKLAGALEDELAARISSNLAVTSQLADNLPSQNTGAVASGFVGLSPNSATQTAPKKGETVENLPAKPLGPIAAPASEKPLEPGADLENHLAKWDGGLDFLNLQDGQTLRGDQTPVQVGFTLGARIELFVNGELVPDNRAGFKTDDPTRGVSGWEFIGVKLNPGKNTLLLKQFDGFGTARGEKQLVVIAPGRAAKLLVKALPKGLMADGQTPVPFELALVDENGTPVAGDAPLTLEATAGIWNVRDQVESEAGVQTLLKGGAGKFNLISPFDSGAAKIRITAGALVWEENLVFAPYLRPLVAAGLVDLGVSGNVRGGDPLPLQAFEDSLPKVAGDVAGRGALFLKGRVQGKYLLTLRYDSADERVKRLFRDIQPDEYYPIYGDASLKGFDAQSTQKLYIRVDSGNSFALWGDFTTQSFGAGRSLGRYGRSLTGAQTHYENEKVSATGFFAQNSTLREVREIRPNGTSGPYLIPGGSGDIRLNSEKVELVIRDRDNPGRVIKTIALTRFQDYSLDGFAGGLLFKSPLLQFDLEGNPQFIRVTFEREANGRKTPVMGASVQVKPSKNLQVGAALVRDDAAENDLTLGAANVAVKLNEKTVLTGEIARSKRNGTSGTAHRVELEHTGNRLVAKAFTGAASTGFQNEEAVLTQGRSETGVSAAYKVTDKIGLLAEAIRTNDKVAGQKITGAQIGASYQVKEGVNLAAGLRHAKGDIGAGASVDNPSNDLGKTEFTSAWLRGNYALKADKPANLFARYEQQLSGGNRSFAIGGDYQVMPWAKIYATHEFFDSPLSLNALGDTERRFGTRFGIESTIFKGGSLYSEYRLADDLDGRSAQAALGLRNTYAIKGGMNVSTSFERTKELTNAQNGGDGTSAALGIESLVRPDLKWNARLEGRKGQSSDTVLASGGVAYAMSQNWSALARGVYSKSSGGTLGFGTRGIRAQIGAAYRPANSDRLTGLFKYEYRDDNQPETSGAATLSSRRRVHLAVADGNYRVSRSIQARLHYAFKKSSEDANGLSSDLSAHYISGRISKEIGRRWTASLVGARWWGNGQSQNAYGVEAGYLLARDTILSLGYNFASIDDNDLQSDPLGKGFYLRLRWKFDEDLFGRLKVFRQPAQGGAAKTFEPLVEGVGGATFEGQRSAGLEGLSGGIGGARAE